VSITLLCAAGALAWDGLTVTASPFASLHAGALCADAGGFAQASYAPEWATLREESTAVRKALGALEAFQAEVKGLDGNIAALKSVGKEAPEVAAGARDAVDGEGEVLIVGSIVNPEDLSSHDGLSATHFANTWTHNPPSNTHDQKTNSHSAATNVHLKNTDSHNANTNVHLKDTTSHTVNTTVHLASTGVHQVNTDYHDPNTNSHTVDTTVHLSDTTTHAPDTTLHEPDTDTHYADTTFHNDETDTHTPDSTVHTSDTTLYPPPK
jgi:hypothetical protein